MSSATVIAPRGEQLAQVRRGVAAWRNAGGPQVDGGDLEPGGYVDLI